MNFTKIAGRLNNIPIKHEKISVMPKTKIASTNREDELVSFNFSFIPYVGSYKLKKKIRLRKIQNKDDFIK